MALRNSLRWLTRWLNARPWLVVLIIVAVVMAPGFYRLEQIVGAIRETQQNTADAVAEIRKTQETGSPVLKAIAATQAEIEEAVKASTALNEAVLPCFDPTSDCAKKAAAQEAARAGAYNAAVIAAQFCSDQVLGETYTLEQLTRCVGNRINGSKGTKR